MFRRVSIFKLVIFLMIWSGLTSCGDGGSNAGSGGTDGECTSVPGGLPIVTLNTPTAGATQFSGNVCNARTVGAGKSMKHKQFGGRGIPKARPLPPLIFLDLYMPVLKIVSATLHWCFAGDFDMQLDSHFLEGFVQIAT